MVIYFLIFVRVASPIYGHLVVLLFPIDTILTLSNEFAVYIFVWIINKQITTGYWFRYDQRQYERIEKWRTNWQQAKKKAYVILQNMYTNGILYWVIWVENALSYFATTELGSCYISLFLQNFAFYVTYFTFMLADLITNTFRSISSERYLSTPFKLQD